MKKFDNIAAQGDMLLIRIDALPKDAKPALAENGAFILTHSETGHHHIVMERPIAERGRYPAINVLKSVSRSMPRSADPAYLDVLARARRVMSTYADMEELIRLGAYRLGSSPEVDEAIALHAPLEAFLGQAREESTSLAEGYRMLEQILAGPAPKPAA